MKEHDDKRSGSGCAIGLVLMVVLLLPFVYVFSLGPAILIVNLYPACEEVAFVVYYPLEWVHENFETAGVWLVLGAMTFRPAPTVAWG